ncbi:MAG: GNAT family N-acetyltransferase [Thermomicrobiales bacterium]
MTVALSRNTPIASEAINRLRAAAWEGPQTGDWEPVLARSLGWVRATDGDGLIGFVNVAWDGGVHAFLLDTTVHPDYQRRGIGTALVREAAALARDGGAEWLHVDYEEELASFYRGCGFRATTAGLLRLAVSSDAAAPEFKHECP